MLHVFCADGKGGWKLDDESIRRADEVGCGCKTERGDRAAMLVTPEEGRFSQMMLGVTRSIGDFYHQMYGVTWEPEVVVHDLATFCNGAPEAVLCIASDGVWDHWRFEEAIEALTVGGGARHRPRARGTSWRTRGCAAPGVRPARRQPPPWSCASPTLISDRFSFSSFRPHVTAAPRRRVVAKLRRVVELRRRPDIRTDERSRARPLPSTPRSCRG